MLEGWARKRQVGPADASRRSFSHQQMRIDLSPFERDREYLQNRTSTNQSPCAGCDLFDEYAAELEMRSLNTVTRASMGRVAGWEA